MDEINLLKKFTNLITGRTRVQALIQAKEKGNKIAIMDDGMQDFTFKKNISILCIKSKQGFGNQKILPSGPLREPLCNIKNYQITIINGEKNNQIEELLNKYNKDMSIYYSNYELINKDQIYNKATSIRGVLEPFTSKANVDYMKRAGFKDITSIVKYCSFEGFLAIK